MRELNKALHVAFVLLFLFTSVLLLADARPGSNKSKPSKASNLVKIKLSNEAISRSILPTGLYAESQHFGINELDQLMNVRGGTSIIRAHRKLKNQDWADKTGWDNWFLVRLDGRASVEEAVASFKQNRYIEEAMPEYIAYTTAVPNDTHYPAQWGHNNTGQLPRYQSGSHSGPGVGTPGFDSRAQLAWDLPQGYGSSSIIIAIIDSGVDTAHEDLLLMAGYDYGDNDSNPMDDAPDAGHGTSCAGVAAAIADNGIGVAGIAGGSTVMPLKIADSSGRMYLTYINNAITHAADYGAHIISMSLGADMDASEAASTEAALLYAYNAGLTSFAATSNEDTGTVSYPANSQYVISVGAASPTGERKSATSSDGETWWGSNWGVNTQDARNSVDIMGPTILPATDISGAAGYTSGNYDMYFNGTSCATPYVAGVAALVLSADPTLTPAELRAVLTSTATDMTIDGGVGWDMYTGYGLVNAYAAISSLDPTIPSVSITAPTIGSTHDLGSIISVNATATDSDGSITQVAFYVDDVWQFTDFSSPYSWNWNTASASAGSRTIKAIATDNDANTAQSSVTITLLAPADEGFESGNFSAYPWVNNSSQQWTVQNTEKYSGAFAAKSGAISHSGVTNLSLTQVVSEEGSISFYYKVSSENGWDKLFFLIDGVEKANWSGTSEWTPVSFPVSAGTRTFTWRYTKDGSVSSGSDCAWIDHIILPPTEVYYAPATNLTGTPGDNSITLSWNSPGSGVLSFKIYRDDVLLTTTTNTTYTDNDVINDVSYQYYVVAVYADGESDPTATIEVTAGIAMEAILGTGTTVTSNQDASPINIYYRSLHGQSVYTKAELNALGIFGPINITQIGFDIVNVPIHSLPNFVVRMKHTTATNVSSWQAATGMQTVYGPVTYSVSTGWDMLTLATPFLWNGEDNIVVDTAFDRVTAYNASGTLRYTTVTSGYRYARSDGADQSNTFTGGDTSEYRPNLKMIFAPIPVDPEITVSTTTLGFGTVRIYETAPLNFTITNTGSGILEGTISTSGVFSVAEAGAKSSLLALKKSVSRSVLNYSLSSGSSQEFTVTFDPESIGMSTGEVTITHNAEGESKIISLSGIAYNPVPSTPTPGNGMTDVSIMQTLNWLNDGTVTAVDVYVGDSELSLVKIAENQSDPLTSYIPTSPWEYNRTYFWKVVIYNGSIYSAESDVFSFSTVDDPTITHFPYLMDFETVTFPPEGWTAVDKDGAGTNWISSMAYNHTPSGSSSALHNYSSVVPSPGQNGWLITPPVVLPENAKMELSFWNYNGFPTYYEYNGVMINTSPNPDAEGWVELWSPETVTASWSQEVLSLNDYAGQTVYLAFVYQGYDADSWYLDDVEIYQVFDYPEGDPITIGEGEEAVTITIDGGNANNVPDGTIPEIPNASFEALGSFVLQLLGEGPWNVTILTSAPWGAYYQGGSWTAVEAEEGRVRFDVEPSKNLNLPILLGDQDVTLPVTLSSFTAVLTAKFDVKIAWVAESETNHAGYNVLRSETDELDSAIRINREILQEGIVNGSQIKYEYLDGEVYWNSSYHYWLESVSLDGDLEYFGPVMVTINAEGDNEGIPEIPLQTALFSAFPNPFNPSTNLRYAMSEPGDVRIDVFNARGQLLKSFRNTHNVPGYYQVSWDGRDANGRAVSTGVYFYRMQSGKYVSTKKMVLSK